MRKLILLAFFTAGCNVLFGQTTLNEDANGNLNLSRVYTTTSSGQIFFQGRQYGNTYAFPSGIFRAVTDNPNGASNYFYDGVSGSTTTYSVRADGLAYHANSVGAGITPSYTTGPYIGFSAGSSAANGGGYIDFFQGSTRKGIVYGDNTGLNIQASSGSPLALWANGIQYMTMTTGGSVGFNTSAPRGRVRNRPTRVGSGCHHALKRHPGMGPRAYPGNRWNKRARRRPHAVQLPQRL